MLNINDEIKALFTHFLWVNVIGLFIFVLAGCVKFWMLLKFMSRKKAKITLWGLTT